MLETRQQSGRFNVELENSDQFSVEATRNYELLLEPVRGRRRGVDDSGGGYGFTDVQLRATRFGQQRRVSGNVSFQRGSFYDGDDHAVGFSGARVSIDEAAVGRAERLGQPRRAAARHFTTSVLRARTDYGFTPRMFASALLQYSSADHVFSSNLRFRWEYRPGSELFVVYTDERDTRRPGYPDLKNRAFVVKINRLFRF